MEQMASTTRYAREGIRFLETIRELIASGQCVLGRNMQDSPEKYNRGEFIGWDIDQDSVVYVLPAVALNAVRKISEVIITKNSLYRQLEEEDAIAKKGQGETTLIKKLGGKNNRVLAIKREKIFIQDSE